MHECFKGIKHSLFIFISHSLLSFGSWANFKVLTLDFEWFQNSFRFSACLELTNSDITSFISDNFPDCCTIMKDGKQ